MLGNVALAETRLFEDARRRLAQLLPATWSFSLDTEGVPDHGYDAILTIHPPHGSPTRLAVVAKLWAQESAKRLIYRLRFLPTDPPTVILTDFATPALRRGCEEAGLGYLDLTGWAHLVNDSGLLIRTPGALRSPAPANSRGTAMTRLDGPGASTVIRTLWEVALPIGVRDLASRAFVSPGTVAKVLPTLAAYDAIERDERGAVLSIDRRVLIERWTEDYRIYSTNPEVRWLLDPRGPRHAYNRLQHVWDQDELRGEGVALTGDLAVLAELPHSSETFSSVIPHTLLSLYTSDPKLLSDALGLRETKAANANVVLIRPRDEDLLSLDLFPVPLSQAVADLMTMGGRFPELAEQVLEVLATTSSST